MSNHSTYRRHRRKLASDINLVPFIDVMLVMLIIFMVTSPMLDLTQGVEVNLPRAEGKPVEKINQASTGPVVITLQQDGTIYLQHVPEQPQAAEITLQALLTRILALHAADAQRVVLLRGDAQARHGQVVELMAWLQAGGVANLGILTRPPGAAP